MDFLYGGSGSSREDFLAKDNLAGQTLLQLVGRGSSIIAELLRLSDHIPGVLSGADAGERAKYKDILFDFAYLKKQEHFEQLIVNNDVLLERDEELRETHSEMISRFYQLFESIHRYYSDLIAYFRNVEDNAWLQYSSVEDILTHSIEGAQLVCESVYLYGVMLLILDVKIPGVVRENIIVLFYRYYGSLAELSIRDVAKLCKQTGFEYGKNRPIGYPQLYLNRFRLPKNVIDLIISKLQTHDIYHLSLAYPHRRHRTLMLANQSSMIYVVLYFTQPLMLEYDRSGMRSIVDRFFSDNCIVPIYMGLLVDLNDWWSHPQLVQRERLLAQQQQLSAKELKKLKKKKSSSSSSSSKKKKSKSSVMEDDAESAAALSVKSLDEAEIEGHSYKAARLALQNINEPRNIERMLEYHKKMIERLKKGLKYHLTEGVLTEEYVMDNLSKILDLMRDGNFTLKWIILHRNVANTVFRNAVSELMSVSHILILLMKISDFEFKVKSILTILLEKKQEKWEYNKKECYDRMLELSDFFSGDKSLKKIKANPKLQSWFEKLANEINNLDVNGDANLQGQKIVRLGKALEEVQRYHSIGASLQIRQFILDTSVYLKKMVRTVNVRNEVLATIGIVSDFSYAWEVMNDYVSVMQSYVKKDPKVVLMLRACFLKMVSILDAPLIRLNQCNSDDLVSVSSYFSEKLVSFVRKVLDVVPKTMFDMLANVAVLRQQRLPALDLKFERKKLKSVSLLNERFQLAELTHRISVFTEGILNMKTTLFGVIEVEPHQLLEDGIKKELVFRISRALNLNLRYDGVNPETGAKVSQSSVMTLEDSLVKLSQFLGSFQSSFEHIQDYIKMYGLRVWQDEFERIICYYCEQECNRFLKKKILDNESFYQSEQIPIPRFMKWKSMDASNFTGRLVNELIRLTHYRTSIFVDFEQAWVKPSSEGSYYTSVSESGSISDSKGSSSSGGSSKKKGHTSSRAGVSSLLGSVKGKPNFTASLRTFNLILQGLNPIGLNSADKVIGYMIVSDLQSFVKSYLTRIVSNSGVRMLLNDLRNKLKSHSQPSSSMYRVFVDKLRPYLGYLERDLCSVGQKQLLRRQLKSAIAFQSKLDASMLVCALSSVNDAVLHDLKKSHHSIQMDGVNHNDEKSSLLLGELDDYLEFVGICDPLAKIYFTTDDRLADLPLLLALFVLHRLCFSGGLVEFNPLFGTVLINTEPVEWITVGGGGFFNSKKSKQKKVRRVRSDSYVCCTAMSVGVLTLLKQCHPSQTQQFIRHLCQFVRGSILGGCTPTESAAGFEVSAPESLQSSSKDSLQATMAREARLVLYFLDCLVKYGPHIDRKDIEAELPAYLFDVYAD